MKDKHCLTNTLTRSLAFFGFGLLGLCQGAFGQTTPSVEELWQIIQKQQAEIERLTELVESNRTVITTTNEQASNAAEEVDQLKAEQEMVATQVEATVLAVEEMQESGGSQSTGWWERTSIGGYGELHANMFEDADDVIDFHRFVLFINHEFTDWVKLYTELEVEHSLAGDGKPGEVELEQAFVRLDWQDGFSTDAGLFLMPIGMLNEIHEPDTFYGVERNNIEARIIPTTWWEAGVRGNWRFDNGVSLDAGVTSGLDISSSGVIRSGRQKVALAINEKPGFVGRIKYTGVPGLELGLSAFYQNDMAQSDPIADISGLLTAGHVDYRKGPFRIRALYARWDLDGTDSPLAENQSGYYIEPSYRWELEDIPGAFGVYFRYSDYKYFSSALLQNEIYEVGINYWPVDQVVFKVDAQDVSESDQWSSKGDLILNFGVGYQF
ncbi:MAG: porin [Puniceicoccaceae bacterium]